MKFRKSLLFLLAPATVFASNYVNFIDLERNNAIVGDYTDVVNYTDWETSSTECSYDLELDSHYLDESFDRILTCNDYLERIKTITRTHASGEIEEILETEEDIRITTTTETAIGTHLEASCNNIIKNGFGSEDGVYQVGTSSDNFSVYCDMRDDEGWTLIAKSPGGSGSGSYINRYWFINGYNQADITNLNYYYNGEKSALGVSNINKLAHSSLVEVQFIAENDNSQIATFYKSLAENNLENWFVSTEPITTYVCTDRLMTENCTESNFYFENTTSKRYWLDGVNLYKYGFSTGGLGTFYSVHYAFDTDYNVSTTMCSVTGDRDNNAWNDSAADGHWGNGMMLFLL